MRVEGKAPSSLLPPAATPFLLLPVRLETRFMEAVDTQAPELWVRMYPDQIHVNRFDPALDPSLLSNQSYLAPYPALLSFLNGHPETHNPSYYVGEAYARRRFAAGLGRTRASIPSELDEVHPDEAIVLLSTRGDSGAWLRSARATIMGNGPENKLADDPSLPGFVPMVRDMFASFEPNWRDDVAAMAAYDEHNAAVRREVPPERLIEWQPGGGAHGGTLQPASRRMRASGPDHAVLRGGSGLVLGWLGIAFLVLIVVGVAAMAVTSGSHVVNAHVIPPGHGLLPGGAPGPPPPPAP